MTSRLRLLAALAIASAALLTGCAGGSGAGDGPSTDSDTSPAPDARAVSVRYEHSGGLAGEPTTVAVSAGAPPPAGYTRAEVRRILDVASNPDLARARMEPLPEDICCDRFAYRVTVRWSDGSVRSFESLDGLEQPQPYIRLVSLFG